MTPLVMLDMLGKVDIECTVSGSGPSAQAGAVRLVISKCLAPFQTESVREGMRQGEINHLFGSKGLVYNIPSIQYWTEILR